MNSIFDQLRRPLRDCLINLGWKDLKPIQEAAFTPISKGNNVLLIAPTAGGKTEAAMLPLLNRLFGIERAGAKIVYVAPLRALLNNIEKRFIETGLCRAAYFDVFKWHGDVERSKKLSAARVLPDMLLTTPESLDVILCSPFVDKKKFFSPLDAVVIDEAHYFAGNVRGGQLISVLNRLERIFDRDLQRVCLSATIGNPEDVLAWMTYPSQRHAEIVRADYGEPKRDSKLYYFDCKDEKAMELLSEAVVIGSQKAKKSIIFEGSRKAAEKRSKDFQGQCCVFHVHHGSVDRYWRERAEFDLAQAKNATTIIATCTLELGIDVGDLDLIQNEGEFPSVSSYVQRIGRTGRVTPPQRCYAYATDEFEFLKNLSIMLLAEDGIEKNDLPTNVYQLLLQQLIMMSLGRSGVTLEEARILLNSCAAFSSVTEDEWKELFEYWISDEVLRFCDGLILIGPKVELRYGSTNYRDLYVLFDSPECFEVRHGRSPIGTLDSLFVKSKREDFVFILAGKWWRVEEIVYREGLVFVQPYFYEPPPAKWISPRSHEVSHRVARKIKDILLDQNFYIDILGGENERGYLSNLRRVALASGLNNSPIIIQKRDGFSYEVITYAGDRVNILLAKLISKLRKWESDDINYVSFSVKNKEKPTCDFCQVVLQVLRNIHENQLFMDFCMLEEIAGDFDDPDDSKWSRWLPSKYRRKMLAREIFDIRSTEELLKETFR